MNPYGGSAGVTYITTGAPTLNVPNTWYYETYVVHLVTPASITLVLETDNLVIGQRFTVKDDAGVALANPITVSFGGTLECDGALTRILNQNFAAETYEWNGNQFDVVSGASGGGSGPTAGSAPFITITNQGLNDLLVYPPVGGKINEQSTNSPITVFGNTTLTIIPTGTLGSISPINTGVTAAGTNQATATQLASYMNVVTTVGSGQGVILPAATALAWVTAP